MVLNDETKIEFNCKKVVWRLPALRVCVRERLGPFWDRGCVL